MRQCEEHGKKLTQENTKLTDKNTNLEDENKKLKKKIYILVVC